MNPVASMSPKPTRGVIKEMQKEAKAAVSDALQGMETTSSDNSAQI